MLTKRMMGLAFVATLGLCAPAGAVDRDAVAEKVAAQCRKDYPPPDYLTQLGCRKLRMDAFDKLEQEDRELTNCKLFGESNGGCGASRRVK
jgi:hypothetical protein